MENIILTTKIINSNYTMILLNGRVLESFENSKVGNTETYLNLIMVRIKNNTYFN